MDIQLTDGDHFYNGIIGIKWTSLLKKNIRKRTLLVKDLAFAEKLV